MNDWFKGLSRSASAQSRRAVPGLRARIEEEAGAQGFSEVLTAVRWAAAMHEETYDRINSHGITERQAHNLRVIIKRRFRQFTSTWTDDPSKGAALINGYTSKGWPALVQEPGWRDNTVDLESSAVATVTALRPEQDWTALPDVAPK